jgi:hypothetical protein
VPTLEGAGIGMAAPTPLPLVGAAPGFAFSAAEGLVSKHRDRLYQAGRSKHWVKVKNRTHPAMYRMMDAIAVD